CSELEPKLNAPISSNADAINIPILKARMMKSNNLLLF
ncbi:MAG: hypothetical protein ACI9X8_002618, partial [Pseudoalteromonas distincta]